MPQRFIDRPSVAAALVVGLSLLVTGIIFSWAFYSARQGEDTISVTGSAKQEVKADQAKSFEIMGADVKQTDEAFGKSASYLRWQDRQANQKFFSGEHAAFSKEAADLLLEIGIIKQIPDLTKLADPKFVQ